MKNSKVKNIFNFLLLFFITFVVLYFALKDDFHAILDQILHLNIFWFLVAILLYVGSVLVRSFGLFKLIREFKKDYPLFQAVRLAFMTQFFNGVTPFATGGQPFQVYHLRKAGVSMTDGTNIIVQNFVVYQIALVFLGIVAVLSNHFFHFFEKVSILQHLVTLGFICNTLVVIGLLFVAYAKEMNKKIIKFAIQLLDKIHLVKDKEAQEKKWEDSVDRFNKSASSLMKNRKLLFQTIGLNLLGLCLLYSVPLAVAYSMGIFDAFNVLEAIVSSAYVMLIGAFVPIPGGTGGLEYGFVQFFGNFVGGAPLNAMMLIWRFCTYYFGMIIGALALYVKGKD